MEKKSDRPAIEITPEMIEAATDELIESGTLLETHFKAPDRHRVMMLAADVLCAALAASAVHYKMSKALKKVL